MAARAVGAILIYTVTLYTLSVGNFPHSTIRILPSAFQQAKTNRRYRRLAAVIHISSVIHSVNTHD